MLLCCTLVYCLIHSRTVILLSESIPWKMGGAAAAIGSLSKTRTCQFSSGPRRWISGFLSFPVFGLVSGLGPGSLGFLLFKMLYYTEWPFGFHANCEEHDGTITMTMMATNMITTMINNRHQSCKTFLSLVSLASLSKTALFSSSLVQLSLGIVA